jgi:outer membrane receptor for ferrienterochelin and colicins
MTRRDARFSLLTTALTLLLCLGGPTLAWGQAPTVASSDSAAQADSLWSLDLEPVVVTATKTRTSLGDLTVPASVIGSEDIEARGSVRLADLLREETAFQFDYSHGTGVQIQGLDPEYTLLLVDGEPMIGRTAGTLDLDRVSVSNVERIEVVRGPSSSLYGSEALAGVINVITGEPQQSRSLSVGGRLGRYTTADLNARGAFVEGPLSGSVTANFYRTDGYDLNEDAIGQTAPRRDDYTGTADLSYDLGAATTLDVDGRLNVQQTDYRTANREQQVLSGERDQTDWNVATTLQHEFRPGVRGQATLYGSWFNFDRTEALQQSGTVVDELSTDQFFGKAETEWNVTLPYDNLVTAGGGLITESISGVNLLRQGTERRRSGFFFVQNQFSPTEWLRLTASTRFDANEDYGSELSPKGGVLVEPVEGLRVRASVGTGFKAPTFRELYYDFTNSSAGYTVLGSAYVDQGVDRLRESGQVARTLGRFSDVETLEPENSLSFNGGVETDLLPQLSTSVNLFHNDVENLIDSQLILQKTGGGPFPFVFTYFNVGEVYTQGLESDVTLRPLRGTDLESTLGRVSLTVGYQYLEARSRDALDRIEAGEVYRVPNDPESENFDPNAPTLERDDYRGLFNRSTHSGSLQLRYQHEALGLTATLRGTYRGEYGFADTNENGVFDTFDEAAEGYTFWNATVRKTLLDRATLTLGVDNLTGATPEYTPGSRVPVFAGPEFYAGLSVQLY